MPAVEQDNVQPVFESDYETYLRQKSLNAVLTKSAMFSGIWFLAGVAVLSIAIFVRPKAEVVGMDPAGREHPIVISKVAVQAAGAKQ